VSRILAVVGCVVLASTFCLAQDGNAQSGNDKNPGQSPLATTSPESRVPDAPAGSQNAHKPAENQPNAPSQSKAEQERDLQKKEQSDRVLGVVPHFQTTHMNAAPLTPGGKFHLFARSAFDPVTFVLIGAQAGLSQAQNSFPGYGQGAEGYGKRYGAAFTDNLTSGFFANFAYPVLFKQDPRYFRPGEGSFGHRFGHSLVEQVVAHQDRGGRMLHFSNILGAFTAGGISNAYYPQNDRGFGLTMSRAGISLLYAELGGVFSEFWPDVQNRMTKKGKHLSDSSQEVKPPGQPSPVGSPR